MSARALVFVGPRRIAVRDVPIDEPGDGDVLVQTSVSGISGGTELLAYRGEIDADQPLDERLGALSGTFRFPFRYGYACVGRVERSRSDVEEGAMVFAFHPHQDHAVVPASDAVRVDDITPRIATLFPIVETALQVTLDAGDVDGRVVAILGQGPVGIVSALLLERAGARVVAAEPKPWRRAIASTLGIEARPPDEIGSAVTEASGDHGAPLVVEASGAPHALASALPLLSHEGTALVASWYGSKPVELPLGREFHRRRLTIRSTQVSTIPESLRQEWPLERRRREARRLLGELPLDALATHTFPLDEAAAAYEMIDRGEDGVMHVALTYR